MSQVKGDHDGNSEHVDTLYVKRNVTGSPEERKKVSNRHYSSSIAKDQPWMEENG